MITLEKESFNVNTHSQSQQFKVCHDNECNARVYLYNFVQILGQCNVYEQCYFLSFFKNTESPQTQMFTQMAIFFFYTYDTHLIGKIKLIFLHLNNQSAKT